MAGKGRFFGSLISGYFAKGMDELLKGLVKLDPETATEAQIDALLKDFDDMSLEVAKAQNEYAKEQKEADAIQALFDQRLKAAENLQAKMVAATDEATKASFEKSLMALLEQIEEMKLDVEREKAEALDAKNLYEDMKATIEAFAKQLQNTRKQIEAAKRAMKSAEAQRARAEMREATALSASGLKTSANELNTVLGAMNSLADKEKTAAMAADQRARLLTPTNIEKDDDNIAAAMAEVSGAPAKSQSIEERLAALKNAA